VGQNIAAAAILLQALREPYDPAQQDSNTRSGTWWNSPRSRRLRVPRYTAAKQPHARLVVRNTHVETFLQCSRPHRGRCYQWCTGPGARTRSASAEVASPWPYRAWLRHAECDLRKAAGVARC